MNISRFRVRLKVNIAMLVDGIREAITNLGPAWWNGNAIQIELGLFRGEVPIDDMTNVSEVKIEVKDPTDLNGTPLMTGSVVAGSFTNAVTVAEWDSGDESKCHVKCTFDASENNFNLGGASEKDYWLVIGALRTDGQPVTLGACTVTIREDGSTLTTSQVATGNWRLNNNLPEWKYDDGTWHVLKREMLGDRYEISIEQTASGATANFTSAYWRSNDGYPDIQFADLSWHRLNPVMLGAVYSFEIVQAATVGYVNNSDHFRVRNGYPELQYADLSWHRIKSEMLGSIYSLAVEQTASPS